MIYFGALIILMVLGIFISEKLNDTYSIWGYMAASIIGIVSGIILLISLIVLPVNRQSVYSTIKQYEAIEDTIKTARENGNEIENAALTQSIISVNYTITNMKHWNETIFDVFIPDEIEELKTLK